MLTLQKSVPTSTGKFQWLFGSSSVSMSMEPVSKTHSSWMRAWLMFCCFDWLQGGIVSLPFFQCCLGGMNHSFFWMKEFLGVLGAHLLRFTHIPRMFGQAWGPTAKTRSWAFLGWVLQRTRAIGGACCFLHKALSPHSIPSCTALESSYSWGCLLTCSLKKQHFVENFCWTRLEKNLPSFWCSKHRNKETLPASQH